MNRLPHVGVSPESDGRVDLLLANSYFLAYDRKGERIEGPYAPLGPLYIAATVRAAGMKAAFFDGTHASGLQDFANALDVLKPRAVGIYSTVISRDNSLQMAAVAHRRNIPVVAGGPDPSSAPETYLRSGDIQTVGRGEGEQTGVDLARHFSESNPSDIHDIPGLAMMENGGVSYTVPRPFIENLDTVPYPARDLIDWDAYAALTRQLHGVSQLTLMTARGCPFHCTWCSKPIFGNRYRHRTAKNIVGEMLELKQRYRPEMIRFTDDIFTIHRRKFLELADEIEKQDAQIPFECLSRVDLVDREVLQRLRDIGCRKILYGVESGSQRVLDSMKKGTTVEEVNRISRLTREYGIQQYWFIIYGYPPEDINDLRLTIDLIRRLQPDDYGITVAYPLPQTEFYDQVSASLTAEAHWRTTRDNVALFKSKYGSFFYKAAIYGTRAVFTTKRWATRHPNVLTKAIDKFAYVASDAVLGGWARLKGG